VRAIEAVASCIGVRVIDHVIMAGATTFLVRAKRLLNDDARHFSRFALAMSAVRGSLAG